MNKIQSIHAREILDSRGNPTVEVDLTLEGGAMGRASVPSGASTGTYEALELRDGDPKRYGGKGVLKAVKNINEEISFAIIGKTVDQTLLDQTLIMLDGTPNKSKLGANAILGVSLAYAKTSKTLGVSKQDPDAERQILLPVPMMNVINGGAHAAGSTDIQEFMIVPHGLPTFHDALRAGAEIFHALGKILNKEGFQTTVGDEGGYAPALGGNMSAAKFIVEAINAVGYVPGKDISIALDIAASELKVVSEERPLSGGLTSDSIYELKIAKKKMTTEEMVDWYAEMITNYPIVSIEDPLHEDDWEGYSKLTKRLGDKIQIVGDDLYVTNMTRLERGLVEKSTNAILIKLNQIGTVSETLKVIDKAKAAGWGTIISHRSGETEDTAIADLAVSTGAGQIKTGSLCRGERTAKYNQLLRLEESAGDKAVYAGLKLFKSPSR
ncbi:MAG: phosphopyruvate hydratase [Candidatus Paceibacterota bacterium]|jgi:enolase